MMVPLSDPAVQNAGHFRVLIQKSAGKTFWVGITFDMVVLFLLIRQETDPLMRSRFRGMGILSGAIITV